MKKAGTRRSREILGNRRSGAGPGPGDSGFWLLASGSLLLALLAVAHLATPVTAQETSIRVTVRLVNVLATVRDASGQLVPSLTKEDFEVLDEGRPSEIRVFARESEMPLAISLLIDVSGSTRKDLKLEQESALRFVRSILRPRDRLSLFAFNDEVIQLTPFTPDVRRIERALRGLRASGGTSMFDAIWHAAGELKGREGRKVIIVISDGGDTTSEVTFHEALEAADAAQAVIYSIVIVPIRGEAGRDIGGEHRLQLFAERTGGRYYLPETAAQLDPVFQAISEELRTQYVLGFYAPQDAETGAYRRVEVRPRNGSFTVQARQGYYLEN